MIRHSLILAAVLCTGAAHAEGAPIMTKIVWDAPPALNVSDPRLSLATPYAARVTPPDPTGIRRTAIDHRFDAKESLVGSVGYLCGLAPGPNEAGGVASSREPAGTFLGAQLKVALGR